MPASATSTCSRPSAISSVSGLSLLVELVAGALGGVSGQTRMDCKAVAASRINSNSVGLSCALARWMARVSSAMACLWPALQLRQLGELVVQCQLFRMVAQPGAQPFLRLSVAITCCQALRQCATTVRTNRLRSTHRAAARPRLRLLRNGPEPAIDRVADPAVARCGSRADRPASLDCSSCQNFQAASRHAAMFDQAAAVPIEPQQVVVHRH